MRSSIRIKRVSRAALLVQLQGPLLKGVGLEFLIEGIRHLFREVVFRELVLVWEVVGTLLLEARIKAHLIGIIQVMDV